MLIVKIPEYFCNIYTKITFNNIKAKRMKRINEVKQEPAMVTATADVPDANAMVLPDTIKTGKQEFDEWFSSLGGIVVGCSNYVSGTSGGGKTTLLANLMTWLPTEITAMYCREMTRKRLLNQLHAVEFPDNAFISDIDEDPTFEDFMNSIYELKPKVVIVDSLQVIAKEDFKMKNIMSVDDACYEIIRQLRKYVEKNNAILFLVGHNTKDGEFAGANTIIQMMDAHIEVVFDKGTKTRTMSFGQKNRNGVISSIPFDMKDGKIIFATEMSANTVNTTSTSTTKPYVNLITNISNILDVDKFLATIDEERRKTVKKLLTTETRKNDKIGISDIDKMSKNIASYAKILLDLQTGRIK